MDAGGMGEMAPAAVMPSKDVPRPWQVDLRRAAQELIASAQWVFTSSLASVALATGFAAAVSSGIAFAQNKEASGSGGFLNPAVTLGMALRRYVPPSRCLAYLLAQVLGAALGAGLALGVVGSDCAAGALKVGGEARIGFGHRVLLHTVLNTFLALLHLWAHMRHMFMAVPILVGFAYIAACLASVAPLGSDVPNPLRISGLALVGAAHLDDLSANWSGALCGGLVSAALDGLLFGTRFHREGSHVGMGIGSNAGTHDVDEDAETDSSGGTT